MVNCPATFALPRHWITHHDLHTRFPRPVDGLVQILLLTREIRLSLTDVECPITDGQTDVVQPSGGDLVKVVLRDERVPVGSEGGAGRVAVLVGTEGVLVDDGLV
jgi:hypothetical protein